MKTSYTFLAITLVQFAMIAQAGELCGVIDVPTSLTKAGSPWLLRGDIYVGPSARLTLEAGVEILVEEGDACNETRQLDWSDSSRVSIKVDGAFLVEGTLDEPVIIRPKNSRHGQIQWDGIRVKGKDRSVVQIQHLRISGAHRALMVTQSSFQVSNSLFEWNNVGVQLAEAADLPLYNNVFAHNMGAGLRVSLSNPQVLANMFIYNQGYGIWSDSRRTLGIKHNLFFANAEGNCAKCPAGIGIKSQVNHKQDSIDTYGNLFQNPILFASSSEDSVAKRDPNRKTPASQVKDSVLSQIHAKSDSLGKTGLKPTMEFEPLGDGPYRLSRYSPALDVAPERDFFEDEDKSRGDLGMFGGKAGRVRLKFGE